ncbi:uncharacterized protein LOC126416350 [Schistocerca serialis cubense]|uniref:uncharacterized protein LOC126416350 n=1 Tax=Schistocerca serialis cubense TaxID=2023355 RepID=UPI00214EDAD1|nr:uncharacterized protein LOC126416350 [Schistocerca serialis cubense]
MTTLDVRASGGERGGRGWGQAGVRGEGGSQSRSDSRRVRIRSLSRRRPQTQRRPTSFSPYRHFMETQPAVMETIRPERESTATPLLSSAEELNSAAVLAAIIIGVLLTVSLLFSLALLIDCRNRKREASKHGTPRKVRVIRKLPVLIPGRNVNGDALAFVNKICTENSMTSPVTSVPPVSSAREEIC